MIENGAAAIVFALIAVIETYIAGVSPFEMGESPRAVTFTVAETFFNDAALSEEVRVSYLPGFKFGVLQQVFDLSVTTEGSVFVGSGLRWERDLFDGPFDGPVYIAMQSIPGLYFQGNGVDLGSVLEFRSGVELGLAVDDATRISIITDHRSNAGIGDRNPGLESIGIRYQRRF